MLVPNSKIDHALERLETRMEDALRRSKDPYDYINRDPYSTYLDAVEYLRKLNERIGVDDDYEYPFEKDASFVCNPTNRGIYEVYTEYEFDDEEFNDLFANKVVLDIGAGRSMLEKQLAEIGMPSTVVKLDLASAYATTVSASAGYDLNTLDNNGIPSVIARAEYMPFADETFDTVIATYSVPFYSDTADDFTDIINETLRVLKVGGTASFSPFLVSYSRDISIVGTLRSLGILRTMSLMPEVELNLDIENILDGRLPHILKFKKLQTITE